MASPNIIFILIDDMGFVDLGCYGSSFYETPNLDRLAAAGMRFTDGYAACPVCSPTRASLLTGKYPASVGVTNFIAWRGKGHPARGKLIDAPYIDHLPLEHRTVAAALRDGGYQTWHVGKWHLGAEPYYPDQQGFELNLGGCEWGMPINGYFSPWDIPTLGNGEEGEYLTDRLTDEAIRLIQHRDADRPFFLNLAHYTVHTPIQAPQHLVDKYRQKARDMGLDRIDPFVVGEPHEAMHRRPKRVTRRKVQSDPVYAAMIESLDTGIGRILDELAAQGIADDTMIVFTSDNGGLATSEGSPTCNAPLAEGKGWMYEGGTREPWIVHWPGVTAPGSTCDVPISSPDLYPTLLDAAGLPPEPDHHADGVSFAHLLRGNGSGSLDREGIYWHYPHYGNQGGSPGSSVRCGDWKLIEFFEDGRLELYNLREDLGEDRDLAARETGRVSRMHGLLRGWREQVDAKMPEPNPDYVPPDSPAADPRV